MPAAPKQAAATGSRKSRGARGFERRSTSVVNGTFPVNILPTEKDLT